MNAALSFAPLLPPAGLAGLALLVLAPWLLVAYRRGRPGWFRLAALLVLLAALVNPRISVEQRQAQPDVAVMVVDASASQQIGGRPARSEAAQRAIEQAVRRLGGVELRTRRIEDGDNGTALMDGLARALADVPAGRFAGAIAITDGQVHDAAEAPPMQGPLHVLLSGDRAEADRRLVIENAPGFGIVGQEIGIAYRIEDRGGPKPGAGSVPVRVAVDGREAGTLSARVGVTEIYPFTVQHGGRSLIELSVPGMAGELSLRNNRALVTVNGVRDRLRVLLVSGEPHPGERTWRNLLKSDPSVDLVHFTILRPPEKDDFTPIRELALIVFPVQELFETKLSEFDLIVFDRYRMRDVLPPSHFRNIAEYVRGGGALLLAVGPEFAGRDSIQNSPLGAIMPRLPTGRVLEGAFRPRLTDLGGRHPVTADLAAAAPGWGRWLRQIEGVAQGGAGIDLMSGLQGGSLLVVERTGEGRVAQMMSDHIWLWARGFEGGGPQGELLRRLSHWLMKEPELEEESLTASSDGRRLMVERRSLSEQTPPVKVTAPSGAETTITLESAAGGVMGGEILAKETGLYRIEDGTRQAMAAVGPANPAEFADLRTSESVLAPLVAASGGGQRWLADAMPSLRRVRQGRAMAGRGWLGLVERNAYVVRGVTQAALLPGWLAMILAIAALGVAWRRDGR